ncbi:MAG: protein arginine kinase [Pirellulaceae bacterium]|jgi:protein arginine kinase|nr:protein arginine kinase [Mariniblastus sp.]MDB4755900.1 protein arginine kinase [Mariniblastus sp.]MDG2470385.1 protein arginine kinase [Pirellulaceae bacterium]
MKMIDFAVHSGEWLRGNGPESDIVISSRIRLARNLGDYPFIKRCTDIDKANIESTVGQHLKEHANLSDTFYFNVADLEQLDRQFLVERQLISREHADGEGARAVAIDKKEMFSVMINEEDHLRMQVMKSGLDLQNAWNQITEIDNSLEEKIRFAFDAKLGYLTACPTNVGTGMRVSVMLHLPALVFTRQIEKVFRSLQKINLAVRGLYGEGSQAMGDFYQISNQITLGKSEEELIDQVTDVVPVLIGYERKARDYLVNESQNDLFDQVSRAIGTLQNAQQISSEETMHLLSKVRMGVNLSLIQDVDIPTVNKLFIHTQPAHLQILNGGELKSTDRNVERALYLQSHLNSSDGGPSEEN